jgi:tRNA A-37 threonylcarbamoyl transferase component Bud32
MIGKTVTHYRIVGPLGTGGMGVVYSAEDVRLGRPVALKFVPEELARDRQAVDRLISEARTASGLNHPNICTIHDIGEHEGQPFIVMELLKGQTLRDRLASAPLKTHDVIDLGIQVADALDCAHQRSIIHRDIKPANLFLVERGPVKVLDFGLAKLVPNQASVSTTEIQTRDLTAHGVTLGTVSYMSPEQVTGEELDGRTDLFSLGVVMYEALTGHAPFTGKTTAVIFSAILTRAPVAPVVFNPDLPLRLQEAINNCLEKDRELRYQDAAGLRADLRRIKRDLESGRSGVFSVSGPMALGQGAQPTGQARVTTGPTPSAPAEQPIAPVPAPDSRRSYVVVAATVAVAAALATGAFLWVRSAGRTTPSQATDVASSPTFIRGRLALATASIESKDYRAALAYADEVLRVSPDDGEAIRIRESARAMLTRFDEAIARVGQRLAAGDTVGATSALDSARAIDPAAPIVGELSARLAGQARAPEAARTGQQPSKSAASSAASAPQARRDEPVEAPRPGAAGSRASAEPAPPAATGPSASVAAVTPQGPGTASSPSSSKESPETPSAPPPAQSASVARPPAAVPVAPSPAEGAPASAVPERRESNAVPARTESDDAAIRRVVATYAKAIETKDLALFRTVKPNMSADEQRRIEDGFRAVTSQQVNVTILSIEQRGQEASVRLRRRDTIQAGGRQQVSNSEQTMTLARSTSGWVIREIAR